MWPFRSKVTLRESGVFSNFTDFHCHLLPGVDDGMRHVDETLKMLSFYEEIGVKKVWFTPHVMEDCPNETNALHSVFDSLKKVYSGEISLRLGAEYMLDNLFVSRLDAGDVLPIGDRSEYLLVETSFFSSHINLEHTLKSVLSKGFFPVLAHPERYMFMQKNDYSRLRDFNVKFQLNLFSLAGMYGEEVNKKALWLLRNEFYNFCGTDTHRFAQWQFAEKKCLHRSDVNLIENIKHKI